MHTFGAYVLIFLAARVIASPFARNINGLTVRNGNGTQDQVTWDNRSLLVNNERLVIFSGEFHPFRLPVSSLYLDVFQKIKALGFNCASFYVDWALVEGTPGTYRADGIFDLQPFFDAASEVGLYLIARAGPYINAEVSGGGFPGWLQRVKGVLRTNGSDYMSASNNYATHVAKTISQAQITNGGPVILYQPENEYSWFANGQGFNPYYMQNVMDIATANGIVVPFINNDASAFGNAAPGSGIGAVDIYGHDSYPIGFDCANPNEWPSGAIPTNFHQLHEEQSPSTPYAIVEFQGGAYDTWGGPGFADCATLTNEQFERVLYKNNLAAGIAIFGVYMAYGGTNWGNLGFPGGYTSYDYGAAISESRNITRAKYSELKLIAHFLKASSSYLDVAVGNASTTEYTNTTDLTVSPLFGQSSASSFYVIRHTDYTSEETVRYTLSLPTSAGTIKIPQLGNALSLIGRDSKIHVTDYPLDGITVLYSTAEIFSWNHFSGSRTVLIVYGDEGEYHETAIVSTADASIFLGPSSNVKISVSGVNTIIGWTVNPTRTVVQIGDLFVFLIDRNTAYTYWTADLAINGTTTNNSSSLIGAGPYLFRTATLQGTELHLSADFNGTSFFEIIGVPQEAQTLYINGVEYPVSVVTDGFWNTTIDYQDPKIQLPSLRELDWKYVDSLPEIQASYDDSRWTSADHTSTNNSVAPLSTHVSLYGSDYGFHTGYLLFRGHFVATGSESIFQLTTQGGNAFGSSVWLNQTYLGSWTGSYADSSYESTYTLPTLLANHNYVFTILVDNTGLDLDFYIGGDGPKNPRGILDYNLTGGDNSAISWKLTGNLGGETYNDLARGPLNEGGLFAERQGWHQPSAPTQDWESSSPLDGISQPGVAFYSASFDLNIATGWDVPLYITFGNSTVPPVAYRVQLYVNGYQYGKYTNQIGPETAFSVPQGILNYQGENWIALSLWAQEIQGAKLDDLVLLYSTPVMTALSGITSSEQPAYSQRMGAY